MRAILIRHGKTEGNLAGRYVGRTDAPLCAEGVAEAELREKDLLKKTVYVSPLRRARETAAILFPNAKQRVIDGLREMDFGAFEGRTADEMADDPAYRAWVGGMCEGACPGGESKAAFCERVVAAFTDALKDADGDATFVVHGGVVMAALSALAEPKREFYAYRAENLCGFEADVVFENGVPALYHVRPYGQKEV